MVVLVSYRKLKYVPVIYDLSLMLICSFNVRGLSVRIKKNKVSEFIFTNGLNFVVVQESNLSEVYEFLVFSLWGSPHCDWSFILFVGSSRGFPSIWCSSKHKSFFSFPGPGFLGVCLELGVHKAVCYVVNVYFKCLVNDIEDMWFDLCSCKTECGGVIWCVMGDFKFANYPSKRLRGHNSSTSLGNIDCSASNFISQMELVDLPLLGRKFTWFHPRGDTCNRLDKISVSNGL
ncbi:uncharacterized protein LOC127080400 [Lathyrus oleraceus]|uniref:uncharacterized protein LOC127080400 n=1 Tax=Pisum sativum TaxID=3888 RepID=UPI0021D26D5D|nr:uncharacterized protein LOC127080400 [Pisum sativum]